MPSRTIDVTNGDGTTRSIVIPDRSRFAGVKSISKTSELGDLTTQMKVTVTGTDSNGNDNSALSGTYTRANSTSTGWSQVGGNGNIYLLNNVWNFIDGSDGTPSFTINNPDNFLVPWKLASSFASNNVTLSSVEETLTVNRTAPVVTSDKAGESRPLLSKLVGGAAVAYSLRDLNDKAGNNKVITTRRLTDVHERNFLAKEVSNGNLTRHANEQVKYFDTTGTSVEHVTYFGRTYQVVHAGGFPVTFSSTGGFNNTEKYAFTGAGNGGGFGQNLYFNNSLNAVRIGVKSSSKLVTVEGYVRRTNGSSSDNFYVRSYASGGNKFSVTNLVQDEWTFFSGTLNTLNTNNHIQFGGDTGLNLEISNIKFSTNNHDVFVTTWYDQSGNGIHATQATTSKQPKIVESGLVFTGGVTFDESKSTELVATDPVITASSSGTYSAFSVQTILTSEAGYLYGNASTSNGASVYADVDKFTISNKNSASLDNIPRSSGQNVLSAVYNNGDAGLLVNGAGTMTDAGTYGFSAGTSDFIIGNRNGGTSSGTLLTGSINEIIVYNSDQSANRPAIEANIANQYGITLS